MSKIVELIFGIVFCVGLLALIGLFAEGWLAFAILAALLLGYKVFELVVGKAQLSEWRERRRTQKLYNEVTKAAPKINDKAQHVADFCTPVLRQLPNLPSYATDTFLETIVDVYYEENFDFDIPLPPIKSDSIEGARYRDFLGAFSARMNNPEYEVAVQNVVAEILQNVLCFFPKETGKYGVKLADISIRAMTTPEVIENVVFPTFSTRANELGAFRSIQEQLNRNMCALSNLPYRSKSLRSDDLVLPEKYDGDDIVGDYLRDTPFEQLFGLHAPIYVEDETRFAHTVLFASSGHGKTQSLQSMILDDLQRVADDECSLVVMDSQEQLINNISHLKIFSQGQPLHGKLLVIDPKDVHYPISLNMFDADTEKIESAPLLERERLTNSLIDLYDYVLSGLLGDDLTSKQGLVFRYFTRLLLLIPDSTLHTFLKLMRENGLEEYQEYVDQLPEVAQDFFNNEFNAVGSNQWAQTKKQIVRRVHGILEKGVLERMFSHPENKIDLYRELQEPKIILISTSKDLLKESGTSFFGRFFLALLAQTSQERLGKKNLLPCFCYIDEAHDYVDKNLATILEQARKTKMGFILASQGLYQYPSNVLAAIKANTAIKMGGKMPDEGRQFAQMVRSDPSFFISPPKGYYTALIDNVMDTAVIVSYMFGRMEAEDRMSEEEYEEVRNEIRDKYATYYSGISLARETGAEDDIDPLSGDEDDF